MRVPDPTPPDPTAAVSRAELLQQAVRTPVPTRPAAQALPIIAGDLARSVLERDLPMRRTALLKTISVCLKWLGVLQVADGVAAVDRERRRQDTKWGRGRTEWDSPTGIKLAVLTEEVGEALHDAADGAEGLADEVTQVAAVAVAWLESIQHDDR